jgi:outer membrane protein assembly complex protein YaeT
LRRLSVHVVAWLMLACLGGAPLAAQQDDDQELSVGRLSLVGVTSIDPSRLRKGLVTRSSSRIPWVKKNRFTRTGLEADLRRIESFYADRGYPKAHAEATHIDINRQRRVVDLVVTVSEGEPVLLDDIRLTGTDVITPERIAVVRRTFSLKVGRPVDSDAVVASRDLLLREARETGYPFAKVAVSVTRDADNRHATVTLAVDSGTQAVFGTTEVVGNRSISPDLVRRQLEYKQGELYKGSLVEASQRRLYGLEVFQFVNLERAEKSQQESPVTMRATVAEGKHQRLTGGVGYGSEEKFRVDGEYRNLNAFGGARSAAVHGRWSSLDRGVHAEIRQPSFLVSEATLMADGQNWYTYTPAYNSVTTGGRGIFSYESWHHNSYLVTFTGEHDSSSIADSALGDLSLRDELIALGLDPRTGEQNGTLYSLGFDFRRVTVDNLLDPQRGWQIVLHGERAGGFLPGTFNYWSTAGDVRRYHRVTRRLYVAGRAQFGTIAPANDIEANVPFAKRFFLGGASSIRGWGRFEVSPLSESGLPIGGNALLQGSGEARALVRGKFGVVAFVDAGNVWERNRQMNLTDLRYAAGVGVRYATVVGPLRADWGYQINPIPGLMADGEPQTHRWRLHISVGPAF